MNDCYLQSVHCCKGGTGPSSIKYLITSYTSHHLGCWCLNEGYHYCWIGLVRSDKYWENERDCLDLERGGWLKCLNHWTLPVWSGAVTCRPDHSDFPPERCPWCRAGPGRSYDGVYSEDWCVQALLHQLWGRLRHDNNKIFYIGQISREHHVKSYVS